MSFGVGGSLFDDPVGFIKPVAAGGGGLSKVGSAVFRYTSLSDPSAPDFTQTVDDLRLLFKPNDVGFTQSVSDTTLTFKPADVGFTQSVDLPLRMLFQPNDVGFNQDVSRVQLAFNDLAPSDDTYLDENAPDTAHGSATSLLAKTNAALGQNEQITYIAWDFTVIDGVTINTATIDVEVSSNAVGGENASFEVYTDPSRPIIEATATWNNSEPPSGTLRETIVQAVTTTPTVYTLTLGTATKSNMPGNWVYLRLQGTTALGLATITTTSKEGTNGPSMDVVAEASV